MLGFTKNPDRVKAAYGASIASDSPRRTSHADEKFSCPAVNGYFITDNIKDFII